MTESRTENWDLTRKIACQKFVSFIWVKLTTVSLPNYSIIEINYWFSISLKPAFFLHFRHKIQHNFLSMWCHQSHHPYFETSFRQSWKPISSSTGKTILDPKRIVHLLSSFWWNFLKESFCQNRCHKPPYSLFR